LKFRDRAEGRRQFTAESVEKTSRQLKIGTGHEISIEPAHSSRKIGDLEDQVSGTCPVSII
jgi:hypothetical protein